MNGNEANENIFLDWIRGLPWKINDCYIRLNYKQGECGSECKVGRVGEEQCHA